MILFLHCLTQPLSLSEYTYIVEMLVFEEQKQRERIVDILAVGRKTETIIPLLHLVA